MTLRSFLGPVINETSGENVVRGVNKFETGDWITADAPRGDRLTLVSDATLAFGNDSETCDNAGLPARRSAILEDGRLKQFWAAQRNAHYLKVKPTGQFSNLVVPGGRTSALQLMNGVGTASEEGVLEVIRFSWLSPDRSTGDFSSEIRFGYLHKNGQKTPVKGGSLNGNVFTALENCHFSREQNFEGNALVPKVTRFNELTVFGA